MWFRDGHTTKPGESKQFSRIFVKRIEEKPLILLMAVSWSCQQTFCSRVESVPENSPPRGRRAARHRAKPNPNDVVSSSV